MLLDDCTQEETDFQTVFDGVAHPFHTLHPFFLHTEFSTTPTHHSHNQSPRMDTEIHIALQLRHPEALHDDDKGSFVRYKSQLKPDGKNLALGINMGGDKENVKHGGWAFVHAVMRRGTQGADADLDVVSMRKISGPDCDRTGIVIAEGTSVSKCVGAEGRRWILMRMGADEQTGWTIA